MRKLNYSFKKGCGKVSQEDYMKLQDELFDVLGCKTKQHYYQKKAKIPNIPAHVKESIENVFKKYGINNPDDIWDITEVK